MSIKKLFHQNLLIVLLVLVLFAVLSCCNFRENAKLTTQPSFNQTIATKVHSELEKTPNYVQQTNKSFSDYNIPSYSQQPFMVLNNNIPWFEDSDKIAVAFERYCELDQLGRCGTAFVCVCKNTMPTEERGEIGNIKPSGWHTIKYDIVDGKYLYNRCHLVGYQLSGENANSQNLITGTRYLNVEGMLYFENIVADYVESTNNHVLYRVTPVFEGDNLLANGVIIEAYSVEDNGEGICFNVFCYNVQPGITIDYSTGESQLAVPSTKYSIEDSTKYIVNINTTKFHYPSCSSVQDMKEKNKWLFNGTRDALIELGYVPCKRCNP